MEKLSPLDAIKIIVIYRLMLPETHLLVCGGREEVLGDFQSWIFPAGATGIMVRDYLTRKGRSLEQDLKMIRALELEPD
mgnify:CR=1 FL=1